MNALPQQLQPRPAFRRLTVEEYLEQELDSEVRHEYVGGMIFPMVGARNRHTEIVSNAVFHLRGRLRGQPHRVLPLDAKVRIRTSTATRFYYPDVLVVKHANAPHETWQDEPIVIVEVLSDSTRRYDEVEKRDAYLTLPSLGAYLLVEQDLPRVEVYRRIGEGFVHEAHEGLAATIPLSEIGAQLPLADLYEAIEFPPAAAEPSA